MAKEEKNVDIEQKTVSFDEYQKLLERLEKLENGGTVNESEADRAERKRKRAEAMAELEKKGEVKLFKGAGYNDDVFVSINGKAMQIQRGVPVEIPKAYANVLKQAGIIQ